MSKCFQIRLIFVDGFENFNRDLLAVFWVQSELNFCVESRSEALDQSVPVKRGELLERVLRGSGAS